MIEAWGRGIERMLEVCRQAELPDPELREEHPGFWIVFQFASRALTPEVTPEVAPEVAPEVTPPIRLLEALLQGALGRQALQQALGLKDADHFREHYLTPALKATVIEMTLPNKPNSPLQKYRLTKKGRSLVAQPRRTF